MLLQIKKQLYVSDVTLPTQDNLKLLMLNVKAKDELLKQLKLGFKGTFNWNKYQSKTAQAPDLYLNYLIEPNFH